MNNNNKGHFYDNSNLMDEYRANNMYDKDDYEADTRNPLLLHHKVDEVELSTNHNNIGSN